jgi:hypothetical protein
MFIISRKDVAFPNKMTKQSSPDHNAHPKPGFDPDEDVIGLLKVDFPVPAVDPRSCVPPRKLNEAPMSRIKGKVLKVDENGNALSLEINCAAQPDEQQLIGQVIDLTTSSIEYEINSAG